MIILPPGACAGIQVARVAGAHSETLFGREGDTAACGGAGTRVRPRGAQAAGPSLSPRWLGTLPSFRWAAGASVNIGTQRDSETGLRPPVTVMTRPEVLQLSWQRPVGSRQACG